MGYQEYDPELLARLQKVQLEMLHDFTSACEKYHIDYWGAGGTAIGAVRHQGMIPWDDDIDISYRREDEPKIINAIKKEYGDKYWFANPELTPGFPYIPTHMCLKGTILKEKVYDNQDYESGVFLDLYPYDDVFDDPKKAKRQILRAWFWGKLYVLYFASSPVLYIDGFKKIIVKGACKLGNKAMHILHINPLFFYRKAMKSCQACSKSNSDAKRMGWFFDPTPFTSIVQKYDIFPTKFLPFNEQLVRFPSRVEVYLKNRYGDYMQLPPENKRHNHPPDVLIF